MCVYSIEVTCRVINFRKPLSAKQNFGICWEPHVIEHKGAILFHFPASTYVVYMHHKGIAQQVAIAV